MGGLGEGKPSPPLISKNVVPPILPLHHPHPPFSHSSPLPVQQSGLREKKIVAVAIIIGNGELFYRYVKWNYVICITTLFDKHLQNEIAILL